jgi:magnesium-transporting ATPase (P-type)
VEQTGFGTPLKPVQLLWVNLIMDTFGALALATEDPTPELLNRKPYGRFDRLVNAHMWRNITVQAIFQLAVQLGLLWFGAQFLSDCTEGYGTGTDCQKLLPNGQGKNHAGNYRDTVIYNTFVWMQLFNEINCRRIFNELNMVKGVFNNPIFVGIWYDYLSPLCLMSPPPIAAQALPLILSGRYFTHTAACLARIASSRHARVRAGISSTHDRPGN